MPPAQFARTLCLFALLATPSSADEATSPHFLVNGYPLGDARTHLDASETRAYRRALAAFPTAAACLKDGSDPVTATLNLEAFSNLEELEVCLFLTADALRDLEAMRALLGRSEVWVHPESIPYFKSWMKHFGVDGDGNALTGRITTRAFPRIGYGLTRYIYSGKDISIHILFGPDLLPVNAEATLNIL